MRPTSPHVLDLALEMLEAADDETLDHDERCTLHGGGHNAVMLGLRDLAAGLVLAGCAHGATELTALGAGLVAAGSARGGWCSMCGDGGRVCEAGSKRDGVPYGYDVLLRWWYPWGFPREWME